MTEETPQIVTLLHFKERYRVYLEGFYDRLLIQQMQQFLINLT